MRRSKIWTPSDGQGLVLYVPMIEGGGPEANDLSGRNRHGTITGALWSTAGKPPNLLFDGVDDRVGGIGRITEIEGTAATYTIMCWCKAVAAANNNMMWLYDHNNVGEATVDTYMYWAAVQAAIRYTAGVTEVTTTITDLNNGGWHHVAVVKTATQALIYEDGALKDTVTTDGNAFSSNHTFRIGDRTNINSWNGPILRFRIYSRSLTAAEIKDIYTSER